MKINVYHNIEQLTMTHPLIKWHSPLKTCVGAECGHFKHIRKFKQIRKLTCVGKERKSIPREHLPYLG